MFEFIGIIVVTWLLWAIVKGVLKGSIKGTMLRACDYASSLGVPHDFAIEVIKHPDVVTRVRKELSDNNKDFAMLDAYQQYGHAIAELHEQEQRSLGVDEDTLDKVEIFLRPQIAQLIKEGTRAHINHITYVYIGALAMSLSKGPISLHKTKQIVKYIYPEEEHRLQVENAYNIACRSSEYIENLRDILPVVNREISSGKGEFLIKYTRKAHKEIEKMFEQNLDFDPRNESRTSFLDV